MTMSPTAQRSAPAFSAKLEDAVRSAMGTPRRAFVPGDRIPLSVPTYGAAEIMEALDSLVTTRVTMGEKVRRFEEMWAEYIGVDYAVMVNSGSSANLLALAALGLPAGAEIITPAVTWATTVFPISQVGAVPVLVDVEPDSFNIDPQEIERAITPETRAIMLVHLLGRPCNMEAIQALARQHHLVVLEDGCEATGAEWRGHKVGSFGDLGTFSFYFSHHLSTIEGGMVTTRNRVFADKLKSMRTHGGIRDLESRKTWERQSPEIDPRFLFVHAGYNFRPTEIQGAFGIHQLPQLDGFIEGRRETVAYWNKRLTNCTNYLTLPQEEPGHVWLGYPLMVKPTAPFTRRALTDFLEGRGLETRPIVAGNIAEQPVMAELKHRVVGGLPNARAIHRQGFYIGCQREIGLAARSAVVEYIHEFTGRFRCASL